MTVDDVRRPAQLAHGFQHTAGEEDGAFVVVGHQFFLGIEPGHLFLEEVFVVDEIHLHPCGGDGSDLDDQRMVRIVDVEVHPAQTNHLMKLVPAFIDYAETRHEDTDFTTALVDALWDDSARLADGAFREKGLNCLTDVENAGLAHESFFPE